MKPVMMLYDWVCLCSVMESSRYINHLYVSWKLEQWGSTGTKSPNSLVANHNHKRRYPSIIFENVVLIWGFPSKFKPRELKECVSKVFGPDSVTSVYYLDETAAFIQFSKEEFVSNFIPLKETLERYNDPILVLHTPTKLMEGGNTGVANYEVYEGICSSSVSKDLFVDQADAVNSKWKNKLVESREEIETQEPGKKKWKVHHVQKLNKKT